MAATPTASSISTSVITPVLDFVRHPGTGTATGLLGVAMAQFTAAVPAGQRTTTSILGIVYALGTQVLDWLKSSTKVPAAP